MRCIRTRIFRTLPKLFKTWSTSCGILTAARILQTLARPPCLGFRVRVWGPSKGMHAYGNLQDVIDPPHISPLQPLYTLFYYSILNVFHYSYFTAIHSHPPTAPGIPRSKDHRQQYPLPWDDLKSRAPNMVPYTTIGFF